MMRKLLMTLLLGMAGLHARAQSLEYLRARAHADSLYDAKAWADAAEAYRHLPTGQSWRQDLYWLSVSELAAGRPDSAVAVLKRALNNGLAYADSAALLLDNSLKALHSHPQWPELQRLHGIALQNRAQRFSPSLRDRLLYLRDRATRYRTEIRKLQATGDTVGVYLLNLKQRQLDAENDSIFKSMVFDFGWPGKSKVGPDNEAIVWFLVGTFGAETQRQALNYGLIELQAGEVNPQAFALVHDQFRVAQGQPQLFGTQFTLVEGRLVFEPCLELASVDAWRRIMNLKPLKLYCQEISRFYRKPCDCPVNE